MLIARAPVSCNLLFRTSPRFFAPLNRGPQLTKPVYNQIADATLEQFEDAFQKLQDKHLERVDDISFDSGVLKIEIRDFGTWVVNKQPPLMEVWLSSPISGPHHFRLPASITTPNCLETGPPSRRPSALAAADEAEGLGLEKVPFAHQVNDAVKGEFKHGDLWREEKGGTYTLGELMRSEVSATLFDGVY